MKTLFELFDHHEPLYNVLVATAMHPSEIVYFSDADISGELATLKRYFAIIGQETISLVQVICDTSNVGDVVNRLNAMLSERDPDACSIDITGGDEALILAVGLISAARSIDIMIYRHASVELEHLMGPICGYRVPVKLTTPIRARIALSGGVQTGNGHVNISTVDESFYSQIPAVFEIYQRYRRAEWVDFAFILQQMRKTAAVKDGALMLSGPLRILESNGVSHSINPALLMQLATAGILKDPVLRLSGVSFSITSEEMMRRLCDVGGWLQLYLYYAMRSLACFDDVDMNITLNWNNNQSELSTSNELDVVATAGDCLFLISCKTGMPQASALNEVAMLARHFGGVFAVPILATTCNLSNDSPALIRRAFDMDVEIIDARDLCSLDALQYRLMEIVHYWNDAVSS